MNELYFIVGAIIGYLSGQLLLLFFSEEIFWLIDRIVARVRKFFGLESE